MKFIFNIFRIWLYELSEVFKDPGILIFVLFVPLAYPLLYSYVYTNEVVREIPAAVVNDANSYRSREFIRRIDACPETNIIAHCADMNEAKELIKQRKIYGIIHIPSSFEKDLSNSQQTTIGLYCDMSSMLYYKGLLLSANNVSLEMNKEIKVERYVTSSTDKQMEINKMPVEYDYVPLYNTQSGFSAFLIPPVLMLIIQQTMLLSVGMLMGRGRENYRRNTHKLLKLYNRPVQIVLGKTLVFFVIYMLMASYMYFTVTRMFSLPNHGDYATFLSFIIPYLLSCCMFSIFMSALVYRREDCILMFVSLSVPLLFLSGLSWPVSSMPEFWKHLSYVFPSTFGMNGYVRIQSMGAGLDEIAFEYQGLWIQCAVYFALAVIMYYIRIKEVKNRLNKFLPVFPE